MSCSGNSKKQPADEIPILSASVATHRSLGVDFDSMENRQFQPNSMAQTLVVERLKERRGECTTIPRKLAEKLCNLRWGGRLGGSGCCRAICSGRLQLAENISLH